MIESEGFGVWRAGGTSTNTCAGVIEFKDSEKAKVILQHQLGSDIKC